MKTAEFTKIGDKLLAYVPGFIAHGKLFFTPPIGDFLRGVYLENASGTKEFYVRVLFLPLLIPSDHITFWCDRIKRNGQELWSADNPNLIAELGDTIRTEAIPLLNSVSTVSGALDYLRGEVERTRPRLSSDTLEAFAYTLIKAGEDQPAAVQALSELEHIYEDVFEDKGEKPHACVLEQRARARLMNEKLLRNPAEALAQLDAWKGVTLTKLGLGRYYIPQGQK